MRTRKLLATGIVAAATIALVSPATAFGLGFSDVSAQPTNPQAGANSDFNIHMEFADAGDQVKDLIHSPPGLVGNLLATPLCTTAR